MTPKEICTLYIDTLIKENQYYEPEKLNIILKKHNYELNIDCMTDLSLYYDFLDEMTDKHYDSVFNYRLEKEYGITKDYQEKIDNDWNELENDLRKSGDIQ